jgi:hypothetical protein
VRRKTWIWSRFLMIVDYLFGSRLLEWELARRKRSIERLVEDIESVNRELEVAAYELEFYRTTLCLILLKSRSERADVEDWLYFDPSADEDEALLDSAIECLVRQELAGIDTFSSETGHYTYRLVPDWRAIVERFGYRTLPKELLTWLEQQLQPSSSDYEGAADFASDKL